MHSVMKVIVSQITGKYQQTMHKRVPRAKLLLIKISIYVKLLYDRISYFYRISEYGL